MAGLFGTLNTAGGGVRAQQVALQTTGHNLANANSIGYSRQRVTMEANLPQSIAGIGQIGTGVLINGITRVTDEFVVMQLQNETASLVRFEQESEILGQLEALYNEPSTTGIAHQMSELFVSWGNLASNPESITSKSMVIRRTETFLDTVNHTMNKTNGLIKETENLVSKDVLDFNELAEQLKSINDQIFYATVQGERPNDLQDTQDMIVGNMKNIAGVDVSTDKYGRKFITLDGETIVDKNSVVELEMSDTVPAGVKVGDVELTINSGSIKGLQDSRETVVNKQEDLAGFVDNLVAAINTIQTDNGAGGIPFFIGADGSYEVNPDLLDDSSLLVTGKSMTNDVAGDGSRAKAIADLQNISLGEDYVAKYEPAIMSFPNDPSGSTLFSKYNNIVTDLGIIKQQADNMAANQVDLTALLEQRQASISGVDINEEVVNMIQFQSAFQANSRVITTIAEMLDTLINRTGV